MREWMFNSEQQAHEPHVVANHLDLYELGGRARLHMLRGPWDAMFEAGQRLSCPFAFELGREPDDRYPCPDRYQGTCGCKTDGVPKPRTRWKRPG